MDDKYTQKVREVLEDHFPGSRIFFDKDFTTIAPPGLYALCFTGGDKVIELMKLKDNKFFWVTHQTVPFMTPCDAAAIFGPWRLVTEYDDEVEPASQEG